MHISKLQIKNFLSISDVELAPGKINQIVGGNNQGKTTILRALEVAFKGSSDGSLVRHGSDQAEIIIEFDNEMSLRRRIKSNGTQDVQVKKGEFNASSPQSILNGLISADAFNPLDLLDPKRRGEALLKAIDLKVSEADIQSALGESPVPIPPLDYSQHGLKVVEQAHKYFYQRRAEANKDAKAKEETHRVRKSELPALDPFESPHPDNKIIYEKIDELKVTIEREKSKKALLEDKKNGIAHIKNKAQIVTQRLEHSEDEIKRIQILQSEYRQKADELAAELAEAEKQAAWVTPDQHVIDGAQALLQEYQRELTRRAEWMALKEKHRTVELLEETANKAKEFAEKLGESVRKLGPEFAAQLLSEAQLPIEGLEYVDGQFYLEKTSLDHLSSSQALRLAVAISRTLAGPAKLICIDGAELLDETSFKAFQDLIKDDGYTYFLTKVGMPFETPTDSTVRMEAGKAIAQ